MARMGRFFMMPSIESGRWDVLHMNASVGRGILFESDLSLGAAAQMVACLNRKVLS